MTAERPEPVEDYTIAQQAIPQIGPSQDEDIVIPVRVVESGTAREIRRHRTFNVPVPAATATADGLVTGVVGGNEGRTRLRIYNTHATDAVRILDDEGQSIFTGFLLAAGKDMDIFTEAAVWAAVPSGGVNNVTLSVIDEFGLPEA
jgi:hypothetical protein